jgi:hypothetical protein
MSMQQAALPTQAGSGLPATAEPAMPPDEDVAGIGRQAADIIEAILSETDPHHAGTRDALRRLHAATQGSRKQHWPNTCSRSEGRHRALAPSRTGCRKRPDTTGGPW